MSRSALDALLSMTLATVASAGCTEDPRYLDGPLRIEGGLVDAMGEPIAAVGTLTLPIKLETMEDAAERAMLATELGVAVPYVRLQDLAISIEWQLTNLDARPGKARIKVNGANELFLYDPSMLELGDGDEDSPEAPSLAGDIPIDVPASGSVTGVFREDQLDEVAIDLDQITRGNINPFRATLQVDEEAEQFQPMTLPDPLMPDVPPVPMGPAIPRRAFAGLVRVDLSLEASSHMMLTYSVRVRDLRGLLHKYLLAAPITGITTFTPALYGAP
ncbi:MAG TPA: hypothetical protein PKU97_14025 [Kofleriaceae bacterium]|nr:hypothetical protein [Kofleriaceae bacterium]